MLKGVLLWDRVDKQFHVPLVDEGPETRRKFRIEGTPMNTLRTTCVCSVFPYCWVCAEGGFVCHRVLAHDVRVVTCVHGVNLLRSTCLHERCQVLSAQKLELVWKSMSSNVQASCSSEPAVPETGDVVCGVCLWDCEGESCVGPGQGDGAWGHVRCCQQPMHAACLMKWLNIQAVGRDASTTCPLCRCPLSGGSSRLFTSL